MMFSPSSLSNMAVDALWWVQPKWSLRLSLQKRSQDDVPGKELFSSNLDRSQRIGKRLGTEMRLLKWCVRSWEAFIFTWENLFRAKVGQAPMHRCPTSECGLDWLCQTVLRSKSYLVSSAYLRCNLLGALQTLQALTALNLVRLNVQDWMLLEGFPPWKDDSGTKHMYIAYTCAVLILLRCFGCKRGRRFEVFFSSSEVGLLKRVFRCWLLMHAGFPFAVSQVVVVVGFEKPASGRVPPCKQGSADCTT